MNKDTFHSELRKFVIPIAIQNFMLALVSATDAVMLGLIDQDSMAAVSTAGQVQFFLNLLVTSFSAGVGIMAAQYWGKKDIKSIERIAPIGLRVILLIGGIMMLMALAIPSLIMSILTNDTSIINIGSSYLRVVAPSYFICGITQVYFAILKNTGFAKQSSTISSIAVIINIILNAVFIFGLLGFPVMGVKGAALATSLTRFIELIIAYIITKKDSAVQLRWAWLFVKAPKLLVKDFYFYTMPVIGAGLVWGIATIGYNMILGHMNGDAIAANSVTSIAKSLLSCFIRGVGAGAGVMIGNLLGANNLPKAKTYAARLVKVSIVVGILTGIALMALTPFIVRFGNLTQTAQEYLRVMLIFSGFNIMALSINHVTLDGVFCAGGDSKFDMDNNIVFMWFICLPLGALGAFVFKLPATVVFCLLNMDEIIKLPVVFIRYFKYIWLRNITRDEV